MEKRNRIGQAMRKSRMLLSIMLMLTVLFSTLSLHTLPVSAATVKCYTISSGNTTVYSNSRLTNRYGAIYGSDEITVLYVSSNYCRVRYLISGGRTKTGYIPTNAILTGVSGSSYQAGARITTYQRPGGSSYGYIDQNDKVTVLGSSGGYTQVKYPVSGGYKYAFVTTSDSDNYITGYGSTQTSNNTVNSSPSTTNVSAKCYTIKNRSTTVFSNTNLTKRYGSIYSSDEITVHFINSTYSQVTYPISNGRTKTGYINTDAILTAISGKSYQAKARITTYRRPKGKTYGYIDQNDTVEVLGTSDNYTQVKYPVSGGYKYAFITTSDAQLYITGETASVPSASANDRIEAAIAWATAIANDNSHGYSMDNRYGNPDYDCSSFVCYAFRNAGFDVPITATPYMRSYFKNVGFQWIPWSSIGDASNLRRGDILLNENSGRNGHTEIYLGNNRMIGAHGGNRDGRAGDSYGTEISEGAYTFNGGRGWHGVLRYIGQ